MTFSKTAQLKTKKPEKTRVIKSIAQLKKSVQVQVNKYIRLRDQKEKCISCRKNKIKHAGHYIAQGSSGALRFNEDNIHGQCTNCNVWSHGNLIEYRIQLRKKIGWQRLEDLEERRHEVKKWTREELEELLEDYKAKVKELCTASNV